MGFAVRTSVPRWLVMLLLMLVVGMGHFNRVSISVAGAERLIPAAGIQEQLMGFVYSGYLILYTLAMVPGGWLIDRVGSKRALLVVLLGSALGMSLTGLTGYLFPSAMLLWGMLLLTRSVMGMLNAPQHPAAARSVGDWIPPARQNFANGLINFAACVGMSCTYVLFGALIDRFDWTGAALISGGLTMALAVIWWLMMADHSRTPAEAAKESITAAVPSNLWTLLGHRSLLFLTFSYGALGYFQYLFIYWVQYYFEHINTMPDADGSASNQYSRWCATALTLMLGLGMVVGGWFSDNIRRRWDHRLAWAAVPVSGLLVAAVGTLLGVLSPQPEIALVCFALAMGAAGTSEGSFWTLAVEMGGTRGGTAAGILNTGGNAVGLVAPLLTPIISKWLGWQAGFGMASLACFLAALCWCWIDPDERIAAGPSTAS